MKDRVSCEIRVAFKECNMESLGRHREETNKYNRWEDLGGAISIALRMAAEVQELRVLAHAVIEHVMSKDDDDRPFLEVEARTFMNAAIDYLDCLNKEVERLNGNS